MQAQLWGSVATSQLLTHTWRGRSDTSSFSSSSRATKAMAKGSGSSGDFLGVRSNPVRQCRLGKTALADPQASSASQREAAGHVARSSLYFDVPSDKQPILYTPSYDVTFFGLEKLHPFDSTKWRRCHTFLLEGGQLQQGEAVEPQEATREDLLVAHTPEYLESLRSSVSVAQITELPFVALLPNWLVQRRLLRPFRYQTGGTVLAGKLAKERGWAINIGGGFHHCCGSRGGGFCAYADITLAIKFAFERLDVERVMIVDLDAHQGNGHERDFLGDERVYVLDMYNREIYPNDQSAKKAISRAVELTSGTGTEEYLELLETNLKAALGEFPPDLLVYNAGTDVLRGDPLGALNVTEEGVIARDEIVFQEARSRKIPVLMLTSGGYQRNNARVIADSIANLATKKLISLKPGHTASVSKI